MVSYLPLAARQQGFDHRQWGWPSRLEFGAFVQSPTVQVILLRPLMGPICATRVQV